jgi:DNA-binding transcriptional LysR family regulator
MSRETQGFGWVRPLWRLVRSIAGMLRASRFARNPNGCMLLIQFCRNGHATAANWDDLKVLLAISRVGPLTLAANVLGIGQSTCGRRLSALEAGLGAILFLRSKTGLSWTEAGETALARAPEIEMRLEPLRESMASGPDGPEGIVRIVGNPWTRERLSGPAAAQFLAAHPRIDLRFIPVHPRAAVRREATLSLWFGTAPREAEFSIKPGEVPYAFCLQKGLDPQALPWVSFYAEDSPRLAHVKTLERVRRREERLRPAAGDNRVLMAAILAGMGKGLLPILNLHLHPDTVQTKRVQAVTRWLREAIGPVFGTPVPDR